MIKKNWYSILIKGVALLFIFWIDGVSAKADYNEILNYVTIDKTIGNSIAEIDINEFEDKLRNEFNYVSENNFEIIDVIKTVKMFNIEDVIEKESADHSLVYRFYKDARKKELNKINGDVSKISNSLNIYYNENGIEIKYKGQKIFIITSVENVLDEGLSVIMSKNNYALMKSDVIYDVIELDGYPLIKRSKTNKENKKVVTTYFVKPDNSFSSYMMVKEDFYKTMEFYKVYDLIKLDKKNSKVLKKINSTETVVVISIFSIVILLMMVFFMYNLKTLKNKKVA